MCGVEGFCEEKTTKQSIIKAEKAGSSATEDYFCSEAGSRAFVVHASAIYDGSQPLFAKQIALDEGKKFCLVGRSCQSFFL